MTDTKIAAARALAPLLSTFDTFGGQTLQNVYHVQEEGSMSRIALTFDKISLLITANENDDSIEFTAMDTSKVHDAAWVDASDLDPWRELIGKPFGWGWVTINQQGYCDGLLLSFSGIFPQILLNVVASSIKARLIR